MQRRRTSCVGGSRIGGAFAVAAVAGVFGSRALADTWTGGGGDNNWSTGANWLDGSAPVSPEPLVFGGTTRLTPNNDAAAETAFGGITFNAGAGSFNLGGAAVSLRGDINQNSANAQTIGMGLVLDNPTLPTGEVPVPPNMVINVNSGVGAGALSLGQVAFGITPTAAAASLWGSTLNVNTDVSMTSLQVRTNTINTVDNVLAIASGKTVTVNGDFTAGPAATYTSAHAGTITRLSTGAAGTGGSLVVNSGAAFFRVGQPRTNADAGADPVTIVDLSGLSNFTFTGTGSLRVGDGNARGELNLASTANTITAAAVRISDGGLDNGTTGGANNNNGGTSVLRLGTGTNVINADALQIGRLKSTGTVTFLNATNGSVTIAGTAGGASTSNISIGSALNGSGNNAFSTLQLAGHNATVQAGAVVLGEAAASGVGSSQGRITFSQGTFAADAIRMGVQGGTAASTIPAAGEFVMTGGTLTVNNQFLLAQRTTATGGASNASGLFSISAGTATVNTDILDASTTTNTNSTPLLNSTTLTVSGGTLNMTGHNIGTAAAPISNVNISGGSLTNAARIAGKAITITNAPTITGTPVYVMPAGGTLNSPGLTLASGSGIEGGGATPATVTGAVTSNAGGYVDPAGATGAAGTLAFNDLLTLNNGSTVKLDLSDIPGNNDVVNAANGLTLGGTVNLSLGAIGAGATVGQTYTVMTYAGTLTGDQTNLSASDGTRTKVYSVVPTGTTPGSIQLAVSAGSGALSLAWRGNNGNNWELVTGPTNWDATGTPEHYYNQDTVTFDNTSANANAVQLVGTLLPNSVTVNATRNYTFSGSGSIGGSTILTKAGTGTLTVNTANTYTGGTNINQGIVVVAAGGSLGSGAIADNGSLVYDRADNLTVANVISGGGALTKSGAGVLTLSGANTYTGTTIISAGTIKATTGASVGDTNGAALTVASGATFDIGGNTTANNFNLGPKTVHISGNGVGGTAGAIANSGGATQNSAFNNITLDADALITGARLDIGRTTTIAARTLDLAGHTLTVNMTGAQPIFSVLDGVTVTPGNIVAAAGGLNFERSAIVPNNGGTITLNSGTVLQVFQTTSGALARSMVVKGNNVLGSGNTTVGIISSNMSLEGNVTFEALGSGVPSLTANNPLTVEGVISETGGARSVTKLGVSTLTLTGANTYTGGTTVTGGTLVLGNADATGGGAINIANGALAQAQSGLPKAVTVTTLATNTSGKFDLTDNSMVVPGMPAAQVQALLQSGYNGGHWDGATGIVSTIAAASTETSVGYASNVSLNLTSFKGVTGLGAGDVLVKYTYAGDANLDGKVDIGDLGLLAGAWQQSGKVWFDGDFTYNGTVDIGDLGLLAGNWQKGTPGNPSGPLMTFTEAMAQFSAFDGVVVPEPTGLALLGAAGAGLLTRRRRRA